MTWRNARASTSKPPRARHRRPVATAAAVALVFVVAIAACTSGPTVDGSPSTDATPIAGSSSVPATGTSPPTFFTTLDGAPGAEVRPHQAGRPMEACGLTPARTDLADLPLVESPASPSAAGVAPPAGAVPVPTPARVRAVDRQGNWFLVGEGGVARIDPATATPDLVFARTGDCRLRAAAVDDDQLAVLGCHDDATVLDAPGPCSVVVVELADGSTVGAWGVDRAADLGLLDGTVTIVGTDVAIANAQVLTLDVETGTGSALSLDTCDRSLALDHVVDRTPLVAGLCPVDRMVVLVDPRTGVARTLTGTNLWPGTIESDGDQVWAVGVDRRYDADTFEPVGPSAVPPEVLASLSDVNAFQLPLFAIEVPGAVWTRRCQDRCPSGPVTVEIIRTDLATGAVTDRFTAPGHAVEPTRSGGQRRLDPELVAADADGAWVVAGGQLARVQRALSR